jgi:hypothetical protein
LRQTEFNEGELISEWNRKRIVGFSGLMSMTIMFINQKVYIWYKGKTV